jgi:hypothetical protein
MFLMISVFFFNNVIISIHERSIRVQWNLDIHWYTLGDILWGLQYSTLIDMKVILMELYLGKGQKISILKRGKSYIEVIYQDLTLLCCFRTYSYPISRVHSCSKLEFLLSTQSADWTQKKKKNKKSSQRRFFEEATRLIAWRARKLRKPHPVSQALYVVYSTVYSSQKREWKKMKC